MMNEKQRQITAELSRRINRLIRDTLKDIRVEARDEFDRNFQREAFFTTRWPRRKYSDSRSRGLLVDTGALRRSITATLTGRDSVLFQSTVPYAAIHNDGGTITVTRRMKAYFWYRYLTITGSRDGIFSPQLQRRKDGTLRRNKRNRALTAEAAFCRAMALKKVGSKIVIPQRQFIGRHPQLDALLQDIFYRNARQVFTD